MLRSLHRKYRNWEETHLDDPIEWKLRSFWIEVKGADYPVMWKGFRNLYLLAEQDFWPYVFSPGSGDCFYVQSVLCRLAGHPRGSWYFNPGGTEPDYHCRTCGDDLA